MKHKIDNNIESLIENSKSLTNLSNIFVILDQLNTILKKYLPDNLKNVCHVGAIDTKENCVIVYVNDSTVQHLIYNLANPILDNFHTHHFSFKGIITKISHHKKSINNTKYNDNPLDSKFKAKLQELANSIDKPEIVKENVTFSFSTKEIDL